MSALTDRIAAEHGIMSSGAEGPYCKGCGTPVEAIGGNYTIGHAAHIAAVTEAAVREQVARDIETARSEAAARIAESHLPAWQEALANAARIARGGAA